MSDGASNGTPIPDALVQAGLILASELSLPAVLQRIVELACEVSGARYGALGVLTPDGREIHDFITQGVSDEERRAIGHPPQGRGLLGILINEGVSLRVRRIGDDPRSVGFPPNHPPMSSFLGVPVKIRRRIFGNLYLTEKRGAHEFTKDDQRAVETLAAQAAVAVENARLHEEVQRLAVLEDRERIAKELHDGVVQSLFAVGMALQAASQLVGDPQELERRLGNAVDDIDRVIRDLRGYIFALQPGAAADWHLQRALADLADGFRQGERMRIEIDVDPAAAAALAGRATDVVQAAREALSNAVRHSGGTRVVISLRNDGRAAVLQIVDDGKGFDLSLQSSGHGLANLRARAEAMGGALEIETGEDGTRVRIAVPA